MTRVGLSTNTRRRAVVTTRAEALKVMNPALRKMVERIESRMDSVHADSLTFYHQVGGWCNEIKDNPDKYEKGAMKLVEVALVAKARLLRSCALFNRKYGQRELDNVIRLYNEESNFQLNFSHIIFLLSVDDAAIRSDLANEAVIKEWDPAKLHEKIKKRFKRSGGHGRGHKVPGTVPQQVRQMKTTSATWLSKQAEVWKPEVFGNIRDAAPDSFDEDMLSDLKVVRKQQVEMAKEAQSNIARLDRAIAHVTECMQKAKVNAKAVAKDEERPVGHRQPRAIDLDHHKSNGAPKGRKKRRRQLQPA